jgi:hypothetical protein
MLPIQLPVPKTIKHQVLHKNVVFVEKSKLICVVLPDKIIKEYVYPSDMVMDGDVMKKDDFRNAFIKWLADSAIKPADTICIISASALFEKTIPPDAKNKSLDASSISMFIDSIPFQHVATVKRQSKDNTVQVMATNRDLLSSIYHGLEKSACNMLGIFPDLVLTTEGSSFGQDMDMVEKARRNLTAYTQKNNQQYMFDIFSHSHKPLTQMSVSEAAQQPVQPWVVVAVVASLIVGGAGIWYMQYFQVRQTQIALAKKRAQLLAEQQSVQTPKEETDGVTLVSATNPDAQPTMPTLDTSTSTSATLIPISADKSPTPKLLRVQIIYMAQTQKLFDDTYNKLRQKGLYQISNQMSTREMSENKILLSSALTSESVAQIANILQEVGVEASQKQATLDGFDVVIELGKYSPAAPSLNVNTPTP